MRKKKFYLMIILSLTFCALLVVTVSASNISNSEKNSGEKYVPYVPDYLMKTLPEGALNVEASQKLDGGTPVGIRDNKGKLLWQGTSQEYNILVEDDPDLINRIFKAFETGPQQLRDVVNSLELTLEKKLPKDIRVPQNYELSDDINESEK